MTIQPLALDPESTALVVVDVQEKLAAAMDAEVGGRAVRNVVRLVEGARILGLPVVVTEQYPKGLGRTLEPIESALATLERKPVRIEKVEFDACASAAFADALRALDGKSIVVAGMEAHICVYQTARGLVGRGVTVHVPVDACCSRDERQLRVAARLWERAGAVVTSTETVLFDLVGAAGSERFKAISRLVR